MPVSRPKILTALTVPSGGWDLQFQISESSQYDHTLTATVPAGTYFIAWDGQSDDLIYQLHDQMMEEIVVTAGLSATSYMVYIYLDSDNKVNIKFSGSHYIDGTYENDVKLQWTASDADLGKALGFDVSADDESTSTDKPLFTADYQHGYGWYANTDGQLDSLLVEDRNITVTPQSVSLSGRVTSQNIAQRFTNELRLAWLTRGQTFSQAVGYTETPVYPYEYNIPIECWWEDARLGTHFRVYREGRNDNTVYVEQSVATASSTSTITDSTRSWDTQPQQFKGMTCYSPWLSLINRFHVSSHTATVLTAPNSSPTNLAWGNVGDTYWILDHRYQTYVVDLGAMKSFEPEESYGEDYYGIAIPLLRYES